jgi:hypothetical protein
VKLDRRRFLQLMAAGGSSLLMPRRPRAEGDQPRRLIVISSRHGTVHDRWALRPKGLDPAQPWSVDLGALGADELPSILAPLYDARRRMVALDGVSLLSAELDIPGYRHEKGWVHAWTGDKVLLDGSEIFARRASIDQLVAAEIARPDRLPALELSVGEGMPISHAGRRMLLPLEEDPARVWHRLFGLAEATDPLLAGRADAYGFAAREFDVPLARVGAEDRQRLTAHRDLLSSLATRVEGLRTAACDAPDTPSASGAYNPTFEAFARLITAAFSCDLTRVATLSLGDIPSDDYGWGWYRTGDTHNDFAHSVYTDPQSADAMTDYGAFHASQVAMLVRELESMPDGCGGSLMDHTLIVWGGEVGDGWHGYQRYCPVVLGGSWAWETGRFEHTPWGTHPVQLTDAVDGFVTAGAPHQQLLVSVARAMGLDVDSVGLREITSRGGDVIDLTGPLAALG